MYKTLSYKPQITNTAWSVNSMNPTWDRHNNLPEAGLDDPWLVKNQTARNAPETMFVLEGP